MVMIIFLAVSLSLDALGIGASYGVRGIDIPLVTKMILAGESLLIMGLSITLGNHLGKIFSPGTASHLGVGLLMAMGLWLIAQGILKEWEEKKESSQSTAMHMVRTPSACDLDGSCTIDGKEALYLGLVLSIDSFGAGVGAGAAGVSVVHLSICIALFQVLFLTIGVYWGEKIAACAKLPEHLWSFISGFLLIGIAIIRLFL